MLSAGSVFGVLRQLSASIDISDNTHDASLLNAIAETDVPRCLAPHLVAVSGPGISARKIVMG